MSSPTRSPDKRPGSPSKGKEGLTQSCPWQRPAWRAYRSASWIGTFWDLDLGSPSAIRSC